MDLSELISTFAWPEIRDNLALASSIYDDGYCFAVRGLESDCDILHFSLSGDSSGSGFFSGNWYDWSLDPLELGFASAIDEVKLNLEQSFSDIENIKAQLVEEFCENHVDRVEISFSGSYAIEMGLWNLGASAFIDCPKFISCAKQENPGYKPFYRRLENLSYVNCIEILFDEYCVSIDDLIEYLV